MFTMHMLHHLSFGVSDLGRAAAFYDAVLAPLGYVRVWSHEAEVGYGRAGGEDNFALKLVREGLSIPGPRFHLAFSARSHEEIDLFHAAALKHGGQDDGLPGIWPDYGPHYYAAFVIDPDGYPIEAVINLPV
jgi:catechol 2,3-dioxygenase-like lactoylglutathione lyase family enzyme